MKKLLFVSILICSSFNVFAQKEEEKTKPTDKGHFIVDGSVGFLKEKSKSKGGRYNAESNAFSFRISPKVAYFIVDRLALGLEASFRYRDNEYTDNDGDKYSRNSTAISVGPFIRYYLINGLFGQASLGFGTSKSKSDDFESKEDFFSYQLGLGYVIFLNQHISIEPLISYHYDKYSSDQSDYESTNNGFTLGAGFTIYL